VLELAAEGKLSLDDTIEHWLPGLVPNGAAITLRELLNHTSGLFNYSEGAEWTPSVLADPQRIWLPKELIAVSAAHTPYFTPGTDWHYANTNYVLLGLVIEAATGRSVGDELRDRIFQPLGLGETSFPAGVDASGLVHAYVGDATLPGVHGLWDITPVLNPSWLWAAGALVSNADDVTTFYARLLSGRILRADLVTAMRTVTPPAMNYGLGLMRFDTPCGRAFGHEGDFNGYRSAAVSRPNGSRVAVVMVNVDTTDISWEELDGAAERAGNTAARVKSPEASAERASVPQGRTAGRGGVTRRRVRVTPKASYFFWPASTSPRQAPLSVPRVSTSSLNRSRSALTRSESRPAAEPTVSIGSA
jgi:D-alanyl-D-alanine carboxypeptidase